MKDISPTQRNQIASFERETPENNRTANNHTPSENRVHFDEIKVESQRDSHRKPINMDALEIDQISFASSDEEEIMLKEKKVHHDQDMSVSKVRNLLDTQRTNNTIEPDHD